MFDIADFTLAAVPHSQSLMGLQSINPIFCIGTLDLGKLPRPCNPGLR